MVATDDDGGETTSATWSFWTNSQNSAPAQFTLTSPEEGDETGLTPTFTWVKSSDDDLNDELSYTLSLGSNQSLLSDISVSSNSSSDNYSLSFDGVDDFVDFPESFNLNYSEYSISLDFKISDLTNNSENQSGQSILNSNIHTGINVVYDFYLSPNKILYLLADDTDDDGWDSNIEGIKDDFNENQWYNLLITKNDNNITYYIDGVLDGNATTDLNEEFEVGFRLGATAFHNSYFFEGLVDNFSLWSENLSYNEILEKINNQAYNEENGLIGYWSFNEGSGSILTDLSGNGNNGTINGASWSNDAPSNNSNSISYTSAANLTDNTEYHWQVTAEDQSGATFTTPLQSFVVNAENDLPSDFNLLSPGNTTMVTDLTPVLHWDEPTDADLLGSIETYDVYISTDNSFADVTPEEVSVNTYTVSTDLTEDALYYWKVVATDDDGGETSSATWSFWTNNINSAPAEFTLVSPEQNEETGLTPTFNWNESSDADLYDEIAYTLSYGTDPSDLTNVYFFRRELLTQIDGNGNLASQQSLS